MFTQRRTQLEIAISDLRAQIEAKRKEVSTLEGNISVLENAQAILSGNLTTNQTTDVVGISGIAPQSRTINRDLDWLVKTNNETICRLAAKVEKSTTTAKKQEPPANYSGIELSRLRGMTTGEALVEIARQWGSVRPTGVGNILLSSGVSGSKNASKAGASAYQVALHCPQLKKIEPGVFALTKAAKTSSA